jgi:hypothetical protein
VKATIKGVEVEGTPKEIADLVDLLDKPKASTTINIDSVRWYPNACAAYVPYGNWHWNGQTYV